ncbi:MAG: putative Ig domain-containing protein [Planctomycetota bacterium]
MQFRGVLSWVGFLLLALGAGCGGNGDRERTSPPIVAHGADAPRITSRPVITAVVGKRYTQVVTATGRVPLHLDATGPAGVALPVWLTFAGGRGNGTGVLEGTPLANHVGSYDVVVTAVNGTLPDAVQSFRIDVLVATAATAATTGSGASGSGTGTSAGGFQPLPPSGGSATGGAPTPPASTGGAAASASRPVLYEQFEQGAPGWTSGLLVGSDPIRSDWEIGVPATGPRAGYASANCAGTVLGGDYPLEGSGRGRVSFLQSPIADLTGVSDPAFKFYHFYDSERSYDGGNLKISTDGGATFTLVPSSQLSVPYDGVLDGNYGNPLGGQGGYSGQVSTLHGVFGIVFEEVVVSLTSAQVSSQVVVRFEFGSDKSMVAPGWYIDEFSIGERSTLP